MKYSWPLAVIPYTFLDRLKASLFLLNPANRLSIGPETEKFEKELSEYSGATSVLVGSGSEANHLLVETFLESNNIEDSKKVTVFVPAHTWISSVTPWWQRGCNIKFIDINLTDFSFNYQKLEDAVLSCHSEYRVIWPTALIGFVPDIQRMRNLVNKANKQREIDEKNKCFLFADLCECMMGYYQEKQILSCFDMCTTSFFAAHEICSVEGGSLFISNNLRDEYYELSLMLRNHGLARVLPDSSTTKQTAIEANPHIDPQFLFLCGGTNWRNTDINAKLGRLDLKRVYEYQKERREIWEYYLNGLDKDHYMIFPSDMIPFCLPVVLNKRSNRDIGEIKEKVREAGIEARPIIASLPMQPFFRYKHFVISDRNTFPNSKYLNDKGFYVGVHSKVTKKMVDKFINILNR